MAMVGHPSAECPRARLDSETSRPEVKLRPSLQLTAQSASPLSGFGALGPLGC